MTQRRRIRPPLGPVSLLLLWWWWVLAGPAAVRADFDDTVDAELSCPAFTTCPVICVPEEQLNECPTPDCGTIDGLLHIKCPDGHCAANCDHHQRNPCPACASHACPKVDDFYETCLEKYDTFYAAEATCRSAEEQALPSVHAWTVSVFLVWVLVVTVLVFLWSASNHRYAANSIAVSKPLDGVVLEPDGMSSSGQTVTGYRHTTLGTLLFTTVAVTLLGFHLMIGKFAIESYYENQQEALRAFEVVWCIGFVWTFLFKWPYSVRSVFLRRCDLGHADTVCIFTPKALHSNNNNNNNNKLPIHKNNNNNKYLACLRHAAHQTVTVVNRTMSWLFSMPAQGIGRMHYLPIIIGTEDNHHKAVTTTVMSEQSVIGNNISHKYFYFDFRRYNYDSTSDTFQPGLVTAVHQLDDAIHAVGLTPDQVQQRLTLVGPNRIEMSKPNAIQCIVDEFCKPFYTYQAYMLWTWIPLNYWYLAVVHGSCIGVGALAVAFFRYRNEANLYKLTYTEGHIDVLRQTNHGNPAEWVTVSQEELVPGDLVAVAPGLVYCDMLLIKTEGLLLDESALTGESTPMAKKAVDPVDGAETYHSSKHKKHTVTAGTTVLESEEGGTNNLAMVLSTGSFTHKGNLLRDIMSYERAAFAFDAEVPLVVLLLFFESIVGFAVVVALLQEQPVYAWFYGMYVVSTLLPPLLPTVFTVSVGISDNRLSKKRIACSNSEDILVAGKVTKAFFDKTGTLTRQGLDFMAARCRNTWDSSNPGDYYDVHPSNNNDILSDDMVLGMACCHGLTRSQDGHTMIGNPVDRTMFEASGASLRPGGGSGSSKPQLQDRIGRVVTVLKHFDFDHHRMTQSVIVQRHDDNSLMVFCKGSGENIGQVCQADSLPSDFAAALRASAMSGTYQIAMAAKVLRGVDVSQVAQLTRDQVECDLEFVGVLDFKNILRDETPEVIRQLEAGDVQCIMVTGDSVLTGIRIAQESGMVKPGVTVLLCSQANTADGRLTWVDAATDRETVLPNELGISTELAVTGDVWETLRTNDPERAAELAPHIRVYGRCTPFHKVSVVSTFVDMGFVTLMCGDGGNDVGGLKTAHVGVALSDAEASIVSPFTSLDKNLSSVVDILLEGRCALASALASYKYVIMYGQVEAMNNVIMAYFHINFTEYAWAFMDGFWVIGMSFTLPLAKAAKTLAPSRPTASLLGVHTLSSVLGILFINALFAVICVWTLFQQDFFQCRKWTSTDISNLSVIGDNYESTTLFLVTGYQYISTAMSYNFGYEFRESWLKNVWFWSLAAFFSFLLFWVTLVPGKASCFWRVNCENEDALYSVAMGEVLPIQNPWNTTVMSEDYRWTVMFLMLLNTVANIGWDYFVVNGLRKFMIARRRNKVELIPAQAAPNFGGELELAETV